MKKITLGLFLAASTLLLASCCSDGCGCGGGSCGYTAMSTAGCCGCSNCWY